MSDYARTTLDRAIDQIPDLDQRQEAREALKKLRSRLNGTKTAVEALEMRASNLLEQREMLARELEEALSVIDELERRVRELESR